MTIDGGAEIVVQAGKPPIINGIQEERMRVWLWVGHCRYLCAAMA